MAQSKFVKLGEKANSFHDPISGFKIAKNQSKELSAEQQKSVKVKKALKNGHLEVAEEDEFGVAEMEVETTDIKQYTEAELGKKSKEGLINIVINIEESLPEDERSTSAELKKLNKDELVDMILESYESEDEEDEDED